MFDKPLPPFRIYDRQLSPLCEGYALWEPDPGREMYDHVSIGDVGYIQYGYFVRMFNVFLPWNDPLNNKLGKLKHYECMRVGDDPCSKTRTSPFAKTTYHSRSVTTQAVQGSE